MITDKLYNRLWWAHKNLAPVKSSKVVVFEDPAFENEPCRILAAHPSWMACAMHGNILPPVEAYHEMEYHIVDNFGNEYGGVTQLEFEDMLFDFASTGKAMTMQTVTKHSLHGETISALTEVEAIDYLIKKDIPKRVWGYSDVNYQRYRVVDRSEIPENKRNRNYWKIQQDGAPIKEVLPTTIDIRNTAWGIS